MKKNAKELEQSIERYLDFFRNRLEEIRNLNCGQSSGLFRKILCSNLLDSLSKTMAQPRKGNRERIVEFVRLFCHWPTCDKISLPHLVRLMGKVRDPKFSSLRQYSFSLLDRWSNGEVIYLNKDPDIQDVKRHWPKDMPKPLENIKIEFLQHVNLFWRYRNNMVHELRKPGYGIEFAGDAQPFYHSMTHSDTNQETWELVYPVKFYDILCETAINSLNEYYRKDKIDPYSCHIFGTYWIEELNR